MVAKEIKNLDDVLVVHPELELGQVLLRRLRVVRARQGPEASEWAGRVLAVGHLADGREADVGHRHSLDVLAVLLAVPWAAVRAGAAAVELAHRVVLGIGERRRLGAELAAERLRLPRLGGGDRALQTLDLALAVLADRHPHRGVRTAALGRGYLVAHTSPSRKPALVTGPGG